MRDDPSPKSDRCKTVQTSYSAISTSRPQAPTPALTALPTTPHLRHGDAPDEGPRTQTCHGTWSTRQPVFLIGLRVSPSENPVGHGGKKIPQRLHFASVFGSSEAELMRTVDLPRHAASRLTSLAGKTASLAQRCTSDPAMPKTLGRWFLRLVFPSAPKIYAYSQSQGCRH